MSNYVQISMDSDKIPIFSKRRQICYREEKNGYASIVPQGQTIFNPLILNPTTVLMLSLMNGKNTIKDIYSTLVNKYGDKNKEAIRADLAKMLYDLTQNRIVLWGKGGVPYMDNFTKKLDGGYTLRLAFDNDLRSIVKFINTSDADDTIVSYCNPLQGIDTWSELAIRSALFTMMSCIFVLEHDAQIIGIYSLDQSQTTNTAVISNIICPVEHMNLMFKQSVPLIKKAAVCVPKKLRLYLVDNTSTSAKIKKEVTQELFSSVVVLHNEVDGVDIEMLDYEFKEVLC